MHKAVFLVHMHKAVLLVHMHKALYNKFKRQATQLVGMQKAL